MKKHLLIVPKGSKAVYPLWMQLTRTHFKNHIQLFEALNVITLNRFIMYMKNYVPLIDWKQVHSHAKL